jgi:hypothetical protein
MSGQCFTDGVIGFVKRHFYIKKTLRLYLDDRAAYQYEPRVDEEQSQWIYQPTQHVDWDATVK